MERAAKEAAAEHTKKWLLRTFARKEGSTVSREDAYQAYLAECKAHNLEPTNRAALGKLFNKQFGKLEARRLGNREKNKMHHRDLEWKCNLGPDDASHQGCNQPSVARGPRAHTWVMEPLSLTPQPRQPPSSSSSRFPSSAEGRVEVIVIDGEASGAALRQASHSGKRKKAQAMPTTRRADEHASGRRNLAPIAVIEVLSSPTLRDEETGEPAAAAAENEERRRGRTGVHQLRSENEERARESEGHHLWGIGHHTEQRGMSDLLQYIAEGHRAVPFASTSHRREQLVHYQHNYATYHHRSVSQSLLSDAHFAKMRIIMDCSATYKREMWNIVPMNPACVDDSSLTQLFSAPHDDYADTQSLSTYIMLTMSAFIDGHINMSREFFYKAREHLGYLFDETSYDVAAALVPLAWWARFYSTSAEQGEKKQVYYAILGQKICESVGAINDATYMGFIQLAAIQGMTSPTELMAEASKQPAYQKRNWHFAASDLEPPHHNPDLVVHSDMCNIHGIFLQHFNYCMTGTFVPPRRGKESKLVLVDLLAQTEKIIRTLRWKKLANENTLPQQTFNMILSLALSVRAVIHMVLQSRSQHSAAKELVEHMMGVSKSMMIICLHELASNDFLLIRLIIEILAQYRDNDGCELLESFQRKLADHRDFYWIARTYELADAAIDRIRRARELAQAHRSRLSPWHTAGSYVVGAGRVETQHPPSAAYAPEQNRGCSADVVKVTEAPVYAQSPASGIATMASPAAAAWQSAAPPVAPLIDEGLPEQQPATLPVAPSFEPSASELTAVLPDFNEYCEDELGAAAMRESAGGASACGGTESEQGSSTATTMPPLPPELVYQPLGADVPFDLDMDGSEEQYQPGATY